MSDTYNRLLDAFAPPTQRLRHVNVYALLDGARDRKIVPMLTHSGMEFQCLYLGNLRPRLAAAAPYIAAVRRDQQRRLGSPMVDLGWGHSWGVYVESVETISTLHRHFRRLLRVRDPDGRILVFRFYDPRVLRLYLPTCTAMELRSFFGPVHRFVCESDDPSIALAFSVVDDRLAVESYAVGPNGPSDMAALVTLEKAVGGVDAAG
jgi:hypothetical protein